MILSIIENVQRQQSKKPFVEKFVKYAGYPLWNKAFVIASRSAGTGTLTKKGAEPETLIMIPFALENDSSVHSILQVSTTREDTAFKMLYRKLYNQNGYQKTDSANNADELALLFMVMENKSFGYKYFKINDSLLFNSTFPGVKGKRVKLLSQNGIAQRGGGYWLYVTTCYEVEVPNWEGQLHGCPPGEPCPLYITETTCSTNSYYFPEGGGGGSGGGSNPPQPPNGGGGGTGDWSSDPCSSGACSPTDPDGWLPIPSNDLKTLLNLNNAQAIWLNQNPARSAEISNYLDESTVANKNEIAVNHINRMMNEADYLSFVTLHPQTGNGQIMWWEDEVWLKENFKIFDDNENFSDLSYAERQFIKNHPIAAWKFRSNAQTSKNATWERFPDIKTPQNPNPYLNTKADAFRHAYWMALNTISESESLAREYGIAHESETPTLLYQEKDMDLFNNEVGIEIGKAYTDLSSLADYIYGKILEGKMKYLYPLDYNQSPRYDANGDRVPDCSFCRNGYVPGYTTLRFTNN